MRCSAKDRLGGGIAEKVRALSSTRWGEDRAIEMIGNSPAILSLQEKVARVAAFEEPLLITGESGVGKEWFAQAAYLLSPRRDAPYVTVNCPQLLEDNLAVSELFGHVKGSFTGALRDRKGVFDSARGGTVFLDEIGDLPLAVQVMLLRAVASGELQPLGSGEKIRMDVRLIAATNLRLEDLRVGDQFRHDLFFRLQYFRIEVPPLRERGGDWLLLIEYQLEKLRRKYGDRKTFSSAALDRLSRHTWPGNVRELISLVTECYALTESSSIEPVVFAGRLQQGAAADNGFGASSGKEIYRSIRRDGRTFWEAVQQPFLHRDLNRAEVRAILALGLEEAGHSYRDALPFFNLAANEYQRFMDFLRHHDLKPKAQHGSTMEPGLRRMEP